MPQWTDGQLQVIQSPARTLICSAAAGSGKTAVLVERIVRFLREGAEPESFLIVTFTNAAAAEMREKIRARLTEEKDHPLIRAALDQMDLMQISTIHSFCQQLLKNQFQQVDLDPLFRICDTSQKRILFHEAFQDACEELRQENHPAYQTVRERYTVQKAEKLLETLDPFLMSLPNPLSWMREAVGQIPEKITEDHPWFRAIRAMGREKLDEAQAHLHRMFRLLSDDCMREEFRELWKADQALFHVKQSETEASPPSVTETAFPSLPRLRGLTIQESDWKDRYQKIREEFKKAIREVDQLYLADRTKTLAEFTNMRETLQALEILTGRTETLFRQKKRDKSLVDFQDLEQYAVEILSNPASREEALGTWRYLFVDECQDISSVQNEIIRLLSSEENHLFMVGDVKQSIYRFRLADPTLFLQRIRETDESASDQKQCIYLQSNFRSRPEILETTNLVFRSVMKKNTAEMDYSPRDELIPGRKTKRRIPVRVDILCNEEKDYPDMPAVADHITLCLQELLETPYEEKNRNYQYRDCVILMPAVQTDGPRLAEQLRDRGIPVFFDGSGQYYAQQEVQSFRNLLELLDNPYQDLALISVLKEIPFSFSDVELAEIRLRKSGEGISFREAFEACLEEKTRLGEKCRQVRETVARWRFLSECMRVSDLLWLLLQETGLYYVLPAEPGGEVKQANLRMLCQQALQEEQNGTLTLSRFLAYMRDQQSSGDQQSATPLGDRDDMVRIMTIHKSKGLQFPVVFLAGMDKSPAGKDDGSVLFHPRLGLCVDYKDPAHRIARPTIAKSIFVWQKNREEYAEKIRQLYVGMTRAQERLYLITCQQTNELWSMPETEYRVLAAKSFTDWFMPALMQEKRTKESTGYSQAEMPYEIRNFDCSQQHVVDKPGFIHSLKPWLESVLSGPPVDDLWKEDQPSDPSETLVKRSVTTLVRSARQPLSPEENAEEETAETKRVPESLARKLVGKEMKELPAFLREEGRIGPAWRGTLVHRMLSLLDLEALRNGSSLQEALREEKERMRHHHIFTAMELSQIREGQIIGYLESEYGKRMLRADEVRREWNFNLMVRREKRIMLQGVIDCAFREGDEWVILDYKTDHIQDPDAFVEEYRAQLGWYRRALEELTGQKVKEASLYALSLNRAFRVY